MGFSHGASSVLSTMVNTDVLPANQAWAPLPNANWGQYNSTDKKWYYTNVLSPATRPVNGGFIAASILLIPVLVCIVIIILNQLLHLMENMFHTHPFFYLVQA